MEEVSVRRRIQRNQATLTPPELRQCQQANGLNAAATACVADGKQGALLGENHPEPLDHADSRISGVDDFRSRTIDFHDREAAAVT